MEKRRRFGLFGTAALLALLAGLWYSSREHPAREHELAQPAIESTGAAAPHESDVALEHSTLDGDSDRALANVAVNEVEARRGVGADSDSTDVTVLSGRVSWPDGTAAAGARVHAIFGRVSKGPSNVREPEPAVTRSDGTFTWNGPRADSYLVLATAYARDTPADRREREAPWAARQDRVRPGASDIALVLQQPPDLAGRVVDEQGAPIARFRVTADYRGIYDRPTIRDRTEEIESTDGSFTLRAVHGGSCAVIVEAAGYTQIGKLPTVKLPQQGDPLVVVLSLAARLTGRVVDPTGLPVHHARVSATAGGGVEMGVRGEPHPEVFTDEEGRFVFERLPLGTFDVAATHGEWAKSEIRVVVISPSTSLGELELALRTGGTLQGLVLDDRGTPAAGREIRIWRMEGRNVFETTSDATGRFTFTHVPAGEYGVIAAPEKQGTESIALLEQMKVVPATIEDDGISEVVLGGAPRAPVRLRGVVTRCGRALASGVVIAVRAGASFIDGPKFGQIQEDGRYELTLDEPGEFVLVVREADDDTVEFPATIPEASEHEVSFDLPCGGIRGRVQGPDGAAVANVRVELVRDGAMQGLSPFAMQTWTATDESGTYRFDGLAAADYAVAVTGGGVGLDMFGQSSVAERAHRFARSVRGGLHIATDAVLDGVDFVLAEPNEITGKVVDASGLPVAGATVFVRDATGEPLHRVSECRSDVAGRFRYGKLGPGTYWVSARARDLASTDDTRVEVRAGAPNEIGLELAPAAMMRVTVADSRGKPARARISVRNARGWDVSELCDAETMANRLLQGRAENEARFGPLPKGRYVVTATMAGDRRSETTVDLTESSECRVSVSFRD